MRVAATIYKDVVLQNTASGADAQLSAKAMLDATPDCIKILSVDGRLLAMNRAGCLALGVPEDSGFGMPWLPLLPPAVHERGREALRKATAGESARFPGQSESQGAVTYWDNLLTPVVDASGRVLSILCVSRDVTANVGLKKELEDAIAREKLLSQEMQHRIKNVFAIAGELISISEEEASRASTPEAATKILRDKLRALSRASDAVFSDPEIQAVGNTKVDLGDLVNAVLRPYGDRCRVLTTGTAISHGNLPTIALFLHELATNSVKYGALSADRGVVTVHWSMSDQTLHMVWSEQGGPRVAASPSKHGFGIEMVDRMIRSVGGRVERAWPELGLIADMHLPGA